MVLDMSSYGIEKVRHALGSFMNRALTGERIIISRNGKDSCELVPVKQPIKLAQLADELGTTIYALAEFAPDDVTADMNGESEISAEIEEMLRHGWANPGPQVPMVTEVRDEDGFVHELIIEDPADVVAAPAPDLGVTVREYLFGLVDFHSRFDMPRLEREFWAFLRAHEEEVNAMVDRCEINDKDDNGYGFREDSGEI